MIEYTQIFHLLNSRVKMLICVYQIFNSLLNQLIFNISKLKLMRLRLKALI